MDVPTPAIVVLLAVIVSVVDAAYSGSAVALGVVVSVSVLIVLIVGLVTAKL